MYTKIRFALILALAFFLLAACAPAAAPEPAEEPAAEAIVEEPAEEAASEIEVHRCDGKNPITGGNISITKAGGLLDYKHEVNGLQWDLEFYCYDDLDEVSIWISPYIPHDMEYSSVECGDAWYAIHGATVTGYSCDDGVQSVSIRTVAGKDIDLDLSFDVAPDQEELQVTYYLDGYDGDVIGHLVNPFTELGASGMVFVSADIDYRLYAAYNFPEDNFVIGMRVSPTFADKNGEGDGSKERPYPSSYFEGQEVSLLYFDTETFEDFAIALVRLEETGEEVWGEVWIEAYRLEPEVVDGVTHFTHQQHLWYEYESTEVEDYSGTWVNPVSYEVNIIPTFQPTPKDLEIETWWSQYLGFSQEIEDKYLGEWEYEGYVKSPYNKCFNMLGNFSLIEEWGDEEFVELFQLCTGQDPDIEDIYHYVHGMGGVFSQGELGFVTSFVTMPPNSEFMGIIDSCNEEFELAEGIFFEVRPADSLVHVPSSNFDFFPVEGVEIHSYSDFEDYSAYMLADTYLAYLPNDNDTYWVAELGDVTIPVWQVKSCLTDAYDPNAVDPGFIRVKLELAVDENLKDLVADGLELPETHPWLTYQVTILMETGMPTESPIFYIEGEEVACSGESSSADGVVFVYPFKPGDGSIYFEPGRDIFFSEMGEGDVFLFPIEEDIIPTFHINASGYEGSTSWHVTSKNGVTLYVDGLVLAPEWSHPRSGLTTQMFVFDSYARDLTDVGSIEVLVGSYSYQVQAPFPRVIEDDEINGPDALSTEKQLETIWRYIYLPDLAPIDVEGILPIH